MRKSVQAYAPGSVANVICGFDVLGFALEAPGDTVTCTLSDQSGLRIAPLGEPYGDLPTHPDKNTAGVAVQALLKDSGIRQGMVLEIEKGVPIFGGMGSSASSAAAAVVAVNELLDLQYSVRELLPFVLESERVASGVPHADNAAPALLGGVCLIHDAENGDVLRLDSSLDFTCALVHPQLRISTRDARRVLPETVALQTATRQMGHVTGFVAGLLTADVDLIRRSLVDELAEPHRSELIPGYDAVRKAALEQGALGCGISGSGPTMFALCISADIAREAGRAMQRAFRSADLESDLYVTALSPLGARVVT